MFMVPESSFYACGKTLLSIQATEEGLHLSAFSDTSEQNWRLEGDWQMKWREIDDNITYGYALRKEISEKVTVMIEEDEACEF